MSDEINFREVDERLSYDFYRAPEAINNLDFTKLTLSAWFKFPSKDGTAVEWKRLYDQECLDVLKSLVGKKVAPVYVMLETKTNTTRFSDTALPTAMSDYLLEPKEYINNEEK